MTNTIHLACVLNDPRQTYWARCGQGLQDQARDDGIELTIHPVYSFAEVQPAILDCLRDPRVDARILAGTDCSLTESVALVSALRTPIIVCSGELVGMQPACDVIPDLRRAATLAASYLVERRHGQGKIVHIQGVSQTSVEALGKHER
ncbi:MAG TPA: hypothetical protein VKE41_19305 [Roseiflexaceae bacterium]|nr:hypothetical protein [Roseiflexaceae bacterium]